jgi:hypothetical protein
MHTESIFFLITTLFAAESCSTESLAYLFSHDGIGQITDEYCTLYYIISPCRCDSFAFEAMDNKGRISSAEHGFLLT